MSPRRDDDTDEMPALPEPDSRPLAGASSLVEVDLAALSHPGRVRPNNEDHYFAGRFYRGMRTLGTNVPAGREEHTYIYTALHTSLSSPAFPKVWEGKSCPRLSSPLLCSGVVANPRSTSSCHYPVQH